MEWIEMCIKNPKPRQKRKLQRFLLPSVLRQNEWRLLSCDQMAPPAAHLISLTAVSRKLVLVRKSNKKGQRWKLNDKKCMNKLFLKCVWLLVFLSVSLGNILLNIIVQSSMPCSRVGKNNVMVICVPNPPVDDKNPTSPVPLLIRVKTGEDADELHKTLEEKKGWTLSF